MIQDIQIQLNEHLYIKDPLQSELGKAILEKSVDLIYEIGIEDFTFKKLSTTIPTTEASIYRYFENEGTRRYFLVQSGGDTCWRPDFL